MRLQKYLLALFILAITMTTWQAWPSFYENTKLLTAGENDYLPYRLHQGDTLIQDIRPIRNGMNQLTLSFDLPDDQPLPADTQIRLDIYSFESKLPEEELYLTEANLKVFARTEVPVSLGLRTAGKSYRLVLHVDKLDENTRLAIHTTPPSNSEMSVNGQDTGLVALLSINYLKFNWLAFLTSVGLFGLIFILLFLPMPRFTQVLKEQPVLSLLAAPFLTLTTVELLNTLNTNILVELKIFWISLVIVVIFELLLASLFGRIRLAIYFNQVLFLALGVTNHLKLFFRGDPFVAGDLNSMTEAAQTINNLSYIISSRFLIALQLTILYFLLFWKVQTKIGTRRSRWAASAVVLSLLIFIINGMILNPNLIQKSFGVTRYPWNQMVNYNKNGTIIPFIQSTRDLNEAIPTVTIPLNPDFYQVPLENRRTKATPEKPNIIAIMSESFCDFDNIEPILTSETVTPFFDNLKNSPNTRYGNLLVSIFGGGTCNTEFEFLTGSSMLFMADGSLPYNTYFAQPTHGLPDLLNQQGYRSVAIHPYLSTFWNRNLVYPSIGFSDFISLEDFPTGGNVRDFKGDEADFQQIIRTYEQKKIDERLFIFSVTMQNHFPYYSSEEVLSKLKYNIKLPNMTNVESVELYLSLLRQSDDALQKLIYYFSLVNEPTVIVLFGDHLPGNNNSFRNFYENLFKKSLADLTLEETEKLYETPWMIWANYPLPKLNSQVLSPNFLATTVLNLTGNATSPYFQQVSNVHLDVQAMSNKMIILENGQVYDRDRIPARTVRLLDQYWASEYDNVIVGKSK